VGVFGYYFDIVIIVVVNAIAQHSVYNATSKRKEDLEKCAEAADDVLQLQKAKAHLLFVICLIFPFAF